MSVIETLRQFARTISVDVDLRLEWLSVHSAFFVNVPHPERLGHWTGLGDSGRGPSVSFAENQRQDSGNHVGRHSRRARIFHHMGHCFAYSLAKHHRLSGRRCDGDLDSEPLPASRFTGLRCRMLASDPARSSAIRKVCNGN
jgi:hypothetical protein